MLKYLCVAAAALTLGACETTSSRPYAPSTANILAFQAALKETDSKVQVAPFSLASGVSEKLTCRALGALEVAPGKSAREFVESAMRDELFAAGVYDAAKGVAINGELTQLDFNSMGTGSWDISLKLSSTALPEGYEVGTHYTFKTSYSAIKACQNVIDAFTPAVQELIGKAVADPSFKKLAGSQ
ncbi:MAG TPA: hypothetical protein PKV67_09955 [Hyphomonas sp.]|nr:hypothetical protein [Hyphomonas sp.]HRJ79791.1 hypothetical protein [Planctomycetota bacterium]